MPKSQKRCTQDEETETEHVEVEPVEAEQDKEQEHDDGRDSVMDVEYLTVGQAAKLLSCSLYHIHELADANVLQSHRLQDRGWVRIQRESLEHYARARGIRIDMNKLQPRRRRKVLTRSV